MRSHPLPNRPLSPSSPLLPPPETRRAAPPPGLFQEPASRSMLVLVLLLLLAMVLALLPAEGGAQEAEGWPPGEEWLAEGAPAGSETLGAPVTAEDFGSVGSGSLLLATDRPGVYLPAPGLATEVHLEVSGMVLRGTVTQRFTNPTDAWVEGIYVFPLPERAAVDGLRMVAGGRVVEGEIREKAEAREIYEEARRTGRRASLVEQERPNVFTTSVALLGPGEELEVVICYQQDIAWDGERFSLTVPLVVAPRYGGTPGAGAGGSRPTGPVGPLPESPALENPAPENPVTITVDLAPGFPLDHLGSPSHPLAIEQQGEGIWRVGLLEAAPADRDFILDWRPALGSAPGAALFTEVGEDGATYALLVVMPPVEAPRGARLPRETVLVIDTSGSMGGTSIREAKRSVLWALERLRPEDHFNLIAFSSWAERLFPASVPAGPRALEQARAWVEDLEADGGTEMLSALREALEPPAVSGAIRQVVFITDGAVADEDHLFAYVEEHLGASRLFTVGIGSAPNSWFMGRAAELGRGTTTAIARPEEVAERMGHLFAKLESPVLTDLTISWSDPGAETWPERVPDLYLGEPVVVAARLPGQGASGGSVELSGFRGVLGDAPAQGLTREAAWRHRLALPRRAQATALGPGHSEHPGVAKIWARRKIHSLETAPGARAREEEVREAVLAVALEHGLVSRWTSLVAVDRTPVAPAGTVPQVHPIPLRIPAGWEDGGWPEGFEGFGSALPQGGTASGLLILTGLLLLTPTLLAGLLLGAARRRSRPGAAR